MYFPHPLQPDESHRAGRMMMAGRVKVTVTSPTTGEHITILLKCIADNRRRQFKPAVDKNWIECTLPDATHVFAEVPNASGEWNDKVGTYYPKTGKWFSADGADAYRVYAAQAVGHWLIHPHTTPGGGIYQESEECGVCGRELTDPVSIERGIGPVCLGQLTGSQHQVKTPSEDREIAVDDNYTRLSRFVWDLSDKDLLDVEELATEERKSRGLLPRGDEKNVQEHLTAASTGLDGDTTFMGR